MTCGIAGLKLCKLNVHPGIGISSHGLQTTSLHVYHKHKSFSHLGSPVITVWHPVISWFCTPYWTSFYICRRTLPMWCWSSPLWRHCSGSSTGAPWGTSSRPSWSVLLFARSVGEGRGGGAVSQSGAFIDTSAFINAVPFCWLCSFSMFQLFVMWPWSVWMR